MSEFENLVAAHLAKIRIAEWQVIEEEFKTNPDRIPGRVFLTVEQAVAREVVRLMEYARRECPRRSIDDGWGRVDMGWSELILPPEDWKPE